jgi:hypothetical protein
MLDLLAEPRDIVKEGVLLLKSSNVTDPEYAASHM